MEIAKVEVGAMPGSNEENPYLIGLYASVCDEIDGEAIAIEGDLPGGLFGTCVGNGPTPRVAPKGNPDPR